MSDSISNLWSAMSGFNPKPMLDTLGRMYPNLVPQAPAANPAAPTGSRPFVTAQSPVLRQALGTVTPMVLGMTGGEGPKAPQFDEPVTGKFLNDLMDQYYARRDKNPNIEPWGDSAEYQTYREKLDRHIEHTVRLEMSQHQLDRMQHELSQPDVSPDRTASLQRQIAREEAKFAQAKQDAIKARVNPAWARRTFAPPTLTDLLKDVNRSRGQ